MKELQSLDDVFNKRIFRIPDYQRGYAWGEKQLIEFWEDLVSLDKHRSHYTGVLSIKKVPEDVWSCWHEEKWLIEGRKYTPFFIVDGQQRVTTVSIFLQCLIDAVSRHPDHKGMNKRDIYLGAYGIDEIIEKYIVIDEPKHRTINTYKFGYEVDNPSFKFLRHRIFDEPNEGTLGETFYTLNLENAKKFFADNIATYVAKNGLGALEIIYEKLTQRFLFNLYEIDDNFDVFVAFETMNNRGKKLSDLELLKNRLIYLTTLYPPNEVAEDVKESTRIKINETWGEIYNQLGRNKKSPLNDDEFLRAHWIMYFKYSRVKGNDYIRYLLDDYFSPKRIYEKLEVSVSHVDHVEELIDDVDFEDDEAVETEVSNNIRSKRSINEICAYVDSLKASSKVWYSTFFPAESNDLTSEEQVAMDRINRVKIAYFRPLIMAALIQSKPGDSDRLQLLNEIERFIFICFRMCRTQANYGSSHFYRSARGVYLGEKSLGQVTQELIESLEWAFEDDDVLAVSSFDDFISKKFKSDGDGFYAWNDLKYFLFEYEEELRKSRGKAKLGWSNFVRNPKDNVSIEHIYPQTATDKYWSQKFKGYSKKEKRCLLGSLGNLLALSSSINSSLQNIPFPDKKNAERCSGDKLTGAGYENGSYSELEVAKNKDWTPQSIRERGLRMLGFMEKRWRLKLGAEEDKLALLHLSFMDEKQRSRKAG
ncbi:DUF262 domain-containing protein [Pelobacter seleniigenes]|uniref:DUF262 domain-containing protein n=1 Tax=Pelobacter seleniigenes TaxID=407188 RepID=UPI0004A75222|nr:DUF262 domain-containing protein [Pelobacter seleniigenes]